jgi:phospholipase/carboxylesterase
MTPRLECDILPTVFEERGGMRRERLADLDCVVIGESPDDTAAGAAAIFCHGFGAPGTDLVPVANALAQRLGDQREQVRFIFPAAPLSLESAGLAGGRAWWPIDMVRLQWAMETGDFRDLKREVPALLPEMNRQINALVAAVRARWALPMSRLVLGGFSQGAMLTTDVALRMTERPGGLVIWSGTLLDEAAWSAAAAAGSPLKVVQSHAVDDPILPYSGAEELRNLLTGNGHAVEFVPFRGGHTIPDAALWGTAELIRQALA